MDKKISAPRNNWWDRNETWHEEVENHCHDGNWVVSEAVARQLGRCDCVGTSESERCHLHETQVQDTFDKSVVEKDRHIVTRVQHLVSQCPLRAVLDIHSSMTPFEWCRARGKLDCSGMEPGCLSRFNLSSDDNRDHVWRPSGKRLTLPLLFSKTPLLQLL
ncbi:hypothetical protein TNCV_1410301 [Trichonephila clavipes]|nr:hypothetical protein TNCV_1410301 [Trichonephila clavipes]